MYGRANLRVIAAASVCALTAACSGGGFLGNSSNAASADVSRAATGQGTTDIPVLAGDQDPGAAQSDIISGLLKRKSDLSGGPFAQVADAVLAANSRAAEAEFRAAVLRSEAKKHNWLPTLGPSFSLTSMGDFVAQLVVEQVLFDNGRKKAERDYAAADVEVAAVALAQDTNDRVLSALDLYVTAEQSKALAGVNGAAMERMRHFEYVMQERVRGGVSARVDLQIVQQKLNQMQSDMTSDQEAAASALSELDAMAAHSIAGVSGVSTLTDANISPQPLNVLKARAEAKRTSAEAIVARAGFLPGLTANGTIGADGGSGSVNVSSDSGFGFGTGASLDALAQQEAAAQAQVAQAQEDAERILRSLDGQVGSLRRQQATAESLAAQAAANYEIYAQQQKTGHRAVPDVVGIFETKVRTEREAVRLRYEIALIELQIAAKLGTLVNGEQI